MLPPTKRSSPRPSRNNFGPLPPLPVLHYLVRVTGRSHKNLQTFTKPVPSSILHQRIWGRNALFVSCHSSEWSTSLSSAPTHGWQWAFTPAPRAAKQHKGIYTCRQISFSSLAGEVRCALFLSAGDSAWQPHKKHLGGRVNAPAELMLQQRAVLRLAIHTVCDVNLLQFGLSGILWVHIPVSQYWFLMRTNGSLFLAVSSDRNEVAHRDCTSFTYSFIDFTSPEIT